MPLGTPDLFDMLAVGVGCVRVVGDQLRYGVVFEVSLLSNA
jgi:hypothetical protein